MSSSEPIPLLQGNFKYSNSIPEPSTKTRTDASPLRHDPTHHRKAAQTPELQRFSLRTTLNIVGPILLVLYYVLICYHYISRQPVNGVAPGYWIDPRLVFYGWFLVSVFSLNWANSGIVGTEAAAFMYPSFAPKSILQTLWHADRAWGTVSGWYRATVVTVQDRFYGRFRRHSKPRVQRSPAVIWWYLCLDSFLFFIAIPLSGLSMDLGDAVRPINKKAILTGPNATTLDSIDPNDLSVNVGTRWLGGLPTAYASASIVYAPAGSLNVSETYFNDQVNSFGSRTETIRAFFGPSTQDQVHGNAWGIQSNISCRQANPYHDLTLINVKSLANYTAFNVPGAGTYIDADANDERQLIPGSLAPFYTILTAIRDCTNADFCYSNKVLDCGWHVGECDQTAGQKVDTTPAPQAFELVIWQTEPDSAPDPAWLAMRQLPFVVKEPATATAHEYLGYGIHCDITSGTGFADLDPMSRTWSDFRPAGAVLGAARGTNQAPPIQILSKVSLQPFNTWYATNSATNGQPYTINSITRQYAAITPERMQAAMYKILGQAAIETMSREFPPWEGDLMTMTSAKVITPSKIPWRFILGLLIAWAVITIIPSFPALLTPRWAATLDGFEFFKLGVEMAGGEDAYRFTGKKFWKCKELAERDVNWSKGGEVE